MSRDYWPPLPGSELYPAYDAGYRAGYDGDPRNNPYLGDRRAVYERTHWEHGSREGLRDARWDEDDEPFKITASTKP